MKSYLSMGTVNHGFTLCNEKGYSCFEGLLIKKHQLQNTKEKKIILQLNNEKNTKNSFLSMSRSNEIATVNLSLKVGFHFRTFVHQFLKMIFLYRRQGLP